MRWVSLIIVILSGCATPDQWSPESHRRMMMQCRVACGKNLMSSYDAWTAECDCRVKK